MIMLQNFNVCIVLLMFCGCDRHWWYVNANLAVGAGAEETGKIGSSVYFAQTYGSSYWFECCQRNVQHCTINAERWWSSSCSWAAGGVLYTVHLFVTCCKVTRSEWSSVLIATMMQRLTSGSAEFYVNNNNNKLIENQVIQSTRGNGKQVSFQFIFR